jgi:predicted metal-dependent peptidase
MWSETEVSEDEARQIVKTAAKEATEKSQGHTPGHLAEALEALNKAKVRWREVLRNFIGRHVGSRRPTYARRNRKHDTFGSKGVSHHAAAKVVVIIDTSGSIGGEELKQFFGEIEAIAYRAQISILQWDHAFQGFTPKYRKGAWKNIQIKGRGGTDMEAPVKWLLEQGIGASAYIMLTDGHCQWPEDPKIPMVFCITTDQPEPNFGTVVRIKEYM